MKTICPSFLMKTRWACIFIQASHPKLKTICPKFADEHPLGNYFHSGKSPQQSCGFNKMTPQNLLWKRWYSKMKNALCLRRGSIFVWTHWNGKIGFCWNQRSCDSVVFIRLTGWLVCVKSRQWTPESTYLPEWNQNSPTSGSTDLVTDVGSSWFHSRTSVARMKTEASNISCFIVHWSGFIVKFMSRMKLYSPLGKGWSEWNEKISSPKHLVSFWNTRRVSCMCVCL